jgi:hypothetical protein
VFRRESRASTGFRRADVRRLANCLGGGTTFPVALRSPNDWSQVTEILWKRGMSQAASGNALAIRVTDDLLVFLHLGKTRAGYVHLITRCG